MNPLPGRTYYAVENPSLEIYSSPALILQRGVTLRFFATAGCNDDKTKSVATVLNIPLQGNGKIDGRYRDHRLLGVVDAGIAVSL